MWPSCTDAFVCYRLLGSEKMRLHRRATIAAMMLFILSVFNVLRDRSELWMQVVGWVMMLV